MAARRQAKVSFDLRRNLINILGEEHYPYAEFLYHELAANAWDEDATEVHILDRIVQTPAPGRPLLYDLVVSDNGNGMDMDGLRSYFTVGESDKRERKRSERFDRPLIGRLGVGKVAILKVARSWRLTTERHLGRRQPTRLQVEVEVDDWINGAIDAFTVDELEPTGRHGTEIVLQGVRTRMREDRILRHLQRLPLGRDFMVWRNEELVPPRQWHGIDRLPIDVTAEWEENGESRKGRIKGEIWIRPEARGKQAAYVQEPKDPKAGLSRDPAGIEVRVDNSVVTREFFGHEAHGHGVNRIWGWVEVPWLPIVGNRTDYLRDSPAGHAFYEAVKPLFDEVYTRVRYEHDARQQRRRGQAAEPPSDTAEEETEEETEEDSAGKSPPTDEWVAHKYGAFIKRLLDDRPEFAPVIEKRAQTQRGRPAQDRIYPVRPASANGLQPFERDLYGERLAIDRQPDEHTLTRVATGSVLRRATEESEQLELAERVINTRAGVQLRFRSMGSVEAPYRWDIDRAPLTLDINIDHKLYRQTQPAGSVLHRLHCAWIVALALAERVNPASGQILADYLESLSWELFIGWGQPE